MDVSASLGALSQITVEKDEIEKFEFVDSTLELQKRLQELEDITLSFLIERPLPLTPLSDSFADIDEKGIQEFEFYVPEFTRNDVLCLDIVCLSDSLDNIAQNSSCVSSKKVGHEPLEVILKGATEEAQSFLPAYHNGEYEFVLTSAHGMAAGRYIVLVKNLGSSPQSIRAHLGVHPYVAATPLVSGETVFRRNLPRKAEFSYFRFLLQDTSHLLSIRVNSLRGIRPYFLIHLNLTSGENGEESDPDIYVSNKYSGLVRVNRDNYIWRSAMIGSDQIDVHPLHDIRAKRGNTFLIGVIGQSDLFQDFSISVRALSPPPIVSLLPSGYSRDVTIRSDAYSYFSVPVDSALEGKISITVEPLPPKGILTNPNARDVSLSVETLTQQLGRGLYTVDSLTASGLTLESSDEDKPSLIIKDTLSRLSSSPSFLSTTIPPSVAQSEGLFPVAYFSDHSFYPTSHFYVWRASSLSGEPRAFVETSEWKYSNSNACYFSLIGATFPESDPSPRSLNCRITLSSMSLSPPPPPLPPPPPPLALTLVPCSQETDSLDEVWKTKLNIFRNVFEQVDGCAISQQDRSRRMSAEDRSAERGDLQGLTYGEVDLFSFLKILRSSDARDNQVFVDLGCGVAKTLVASALSGIKFMRCIGVELLPGLCAEARKALDRMKKLVQTSNLSSSLQVPLLEIWEGDICDPALAAWTDADIVYVSSLCFPDHVVQKLMKLACNLRPGSTLITLKSPDPYLEYFELVSASWFKMTWGRVLVYFLRRNDRRATDADPSGGT